MLENNHHNIIYIAAFPGDDNLDHEYRALSCYCVSRMRQYRLLRCCQKQKQNNAAKRLFDRLQRTAVGPVRAPRQGADSKCRLRLAGTQNRENVREALEALLRSVAINKADGGQSRHNLQASSVCSTVPHNVHHYTLSDTKCTRVASC